MSVRTKSSFLMGAKGDGRRLVRKVIDVSRELYGDEFSVKDLTTLDQFTGSEKNIYEAYSTISPPYMRGIHNSTMRMGNGNIENHHTILKKP